MFVRTVAPGLVALTALGLLGSAALPAADGAPAGDLPPPVTTSRSGWTLPAEPKPGVRDEVAALNADSRYLGHVESVLVSRCMREAGFRYPVEKLDRPVVPRDESYGLSVSEARRSGYVTQSHILSIPAEDQSYLPEREAGRRQWHLAQSGPDDAPGVEVDSALMNGRLGTSSRGCLADARRALYGTLETAILRSFVAGNARNVAEREAGHDPSVTALDALWSACMAGAGRPGLTDPGHAMSQARKLADGTQAAQGVGEPREIAIADATCQAETGYAGARRTIEDRYLTALLATYPDEIAATRAATAAALERARTIEAAR